MTGRVFLHVGPPKTGTTSVQLALQSVDARGLHFVGVFQPRADFDNATTKLLLAIARGTVEPDADEAHALRVALETRIADGDTVVISEEMLVVAAGDAEIRAQLRNTIGFLAGLPVTAVMTLRDPRAALPSYFQEINRSLPIHLARDFEGFARDGRSYCYDYLSLCRFIETLGADIHLADFGSIAAGNTPLSRLLGPACDIDVDLNFPKANVGRTGVGDDTRVIPKTDLARLARMPAIRRVIDWLRLNRLPGWQSLRRLARRIPLKRQRSERICLEGELETRYLASFEGARRRWNPDISCLTCDGASP